MRDSRPPKRSKANATSWKPGQSGNPKGRPRREVERDYLDVTIGEVSLEEWRIVTQKALEDAKAGDAKAREWLSRYLLPTGDDPEADGTEQVLVALSMMRRESEARRNEEGGRTS